jgi:hypothetical protein
MFKMRVLGRQTEIGLIESKNLTPFNCGEREIDFGEVLTL